MNPTKPEFTLNKFSYGDTEKTYTNDMRRHMHGITEFPAFTDDDFWRSITLPTQEELDTFATVRFDFIQTFKGHVYREGKTLERVLAKQAKVWGPFKKLSDFCGVRIPCSYEEIDEVKADVIECFKKEFPDGMICERPLLNPFEKDIVYFLYGYDAYIGCIVEFQVGHPWAFWSFTQNSKSRGQPSVLNPFDDNDTYGKVKECIMNGVSPDEVLKTSWISPHPEIREMFANKQDDGY